MLPSSLAQRILQRFPSKLAYCFAYGSGVKKQSGYNDAAQKDAMIDLILCVDNSYQWHKENLQKNPNDYSWMRFLGPTNIAEYQFLAAGVYCNTLIPIDDHTTIKYGVISKGSLQDDLCNWSHLYVAGRLHKPVETLVQPNAELQADIETNRDSALRAALLMLPDSFTYFELFHAIASISYIQDFRMIVFGENKNKVKNIVQPQLLAFLQLYRPNLKKLSHCVQVPDYSQISDIRIKQCKAAATTLDHLSKLPSTLKVADVGSEPPSEENCKRSMRMSIGAVNWENSISQSIKNIPTAGLLKAIRYSSRKALKTFSK